VKDGNGAIAGFALLHAHNPFPTFSHTAEFTCFVRVGMTGQGLGSRMLHILEEEAKKQGISCILASISSLNEDSVRFHARHGFTECGRFRGVVKKRGTTFDTLTGSSRGGLDGDLLLCGVPGTAFIPAGQEHRFLKTPSAGCDRDTPWIMHSRSAPCL
jgi:hypothetical protein